MTEDCAVNLVGLMSARVGLGTAARMTMRLMERHGWSLSVTDLIMSGFPRVRLETEARFCNIDPGCRVGVWHVNPDLMIDGVLAWQPSVARCVAESSTIAAVPYWELESLPPGWAEYLSSLDVILAPSDFIAEAVRAAIEEFTDAGVVLSFPQAVEPPLHVRPDRERWFGRRASSTVFLSSFDLLSEPLRKNPQGVLAAFETTSQGRDDMTLALKVGHHAANEITSREYASLRARAQADSRILIIDEVLTDAEMWSLLASADAYVSLHRAEGLGLGMMESMSLGTPVIGTGWSGNLDFMDKTNSILVPYRLVPVSAEMNAAYTSLAGSAWWAEPDIGEASRAMRAIADNASLAGRLGAAAAASSAVRWASYQRAETLTQLVENPEAFRGDPVLRRSRTERLVSLSRARRMDPKRLAREVRVDLVRALRAARLKPPAPHGEIPFGPLPFADGPYLGDR